MKFEGGSSLPPKESVIQKEEYGTLVDREKKKKKKKNNKEREKHKQIDQDKIRELALTSELHQVAELTAEEKTTYSFA